MTKANIESMASAWMWESSGDIIKLSEFMELPNAAKLMEDGVLVPLYRVAANSDALSPLSPGDWDTLAKKGAGPIDPTMIPDLIAFGKHVAQEVHARTDVLIELSSVEVRNIYEELCNTAGFNYQRMAKAVEIAIHAKRKRQMSLLSTAAQDSNN